MKTEVIPVQRANGFAAAAATDCGRLRDHNEDTFHLDLAGGILLVVDGVGGAAGGEVAASIAADRIRRRLERQDGPADVRVREAITLANREILLKATAKPELAGMACVLTLAVLEGRDLTIGHVGDSRLYRLDARGISKLTHDHSPIGELEDARAISETEAMRDERRNEVYRDVGSEPRDPDAADFIELVRTRVDEDAAILICSDGLTDMLPALEVNRIVRRHAGAPDAAVAALIAAANDAGGKDNITVLLVEGRQFRRAADGGRAYPPAPPEFQVPTLPLAEVEPPAVAAPSPTSVPVPAASLSTSVLSRMMRSRALALLAGVLLGLLVPMGLETLDNRPAPRAVTREWTVGGLGTDAFTTIAAALAAAEPGDAVIVEPGDYAEAVTVPAGVELRASPAGRVALVAPAAAQDWTALTMTGAGSSVRGIRVTGTAASPLSRGLLINGPGVTVDDVTLEGTIGVGVDVVAEGATIRSSRFERLTGTAIRLAHEDTTLRQNVFRAGGETAPAAVTVVGGAAGHFEGNVFERFPHAVDPAARADDLIGHDNVVIAPVVAPPGGTTAPRPSAAGRSGPGRGTR